MNLTRIWRRFGVAFLAAGLVAASPAPERPDEVEPVSMGGPATFRRLNEAQYRNSIAAVFAPDINVPGRFDPPLRDHGLLAIGDGKAVISASGLEQYELRAREISAQVLAADNRARFLPCTPKSPTAFDRACAAAFFRKYGRMLFRRPLGTAELAGISHLAASATAQTRDANKGLEAGLARLLSSPNFIFRVERSTPDAGMPSGHRLDDYSLASRISFLLWNAPPDAELLAAAASGELRTPRGLDRHIDRLMGAEQFEQGVRAFFTDMFGLEQFEGLSKDQTIYPKFNSAVAKAAREQLLRTTVEHLVAQKGDYRDLFTTRQTFMNRAMGSIYRVALPEEAGLDGWVPYTFDEAGNRAGILTLAGFLMLDPTHEGRSSPTIRGKTVNELFLCQPIPLPPPNVDFSAVQNTADQANPTARHRLRLHSEDPVCAGCHKLTDPIGLSLENYDAIGSYRTRENGAPIDPSGTLAGRSYANAIELGQVLRDDPAVASCAVQRAFAYGFGRTLTPSEEEWIEYAAARFAADKYRFPALLRRIAASQAFRAVAPDAAGALASVQDNSGRLRK